MDDALDILAGAMQRANLANLKENTEIFQPFDGYAPVTGSMEWNGESEQRCAGSGSIPRAKAPGTRNCSRPAGKLPI